MPHIGASQACPTRGQLVQDRLPHTRIGKRCQGLHRERPIQRATCSSLPERYIAFERLSSFISAFDRPISWSISTECSPSNAGLLRMVGFVSLNFTGGPALVSHVTLPRAIAQSPMRSMVPSVAASKSTVCTISLALVWGCVKTLFMVLIGA